jgi:acetyl esterase/lipase
VHDVASVYEELRSEHGTVLLMGDSAGGGLVAALTVAIVQAGVPAPAGLILVSPWLDLTVTAETFASNAPTDEWFDATRARAFAVDYLQGHDPTDPLASPFFAEHRFPRCLIFVSALEVLLDDTIGFALRLARAGTSLQLVVEGGVQHSFVNLWPDLPESKRALETITRFADSIETD